MKKYAFIIGDSGRLCDVIGPVVRDFESGLVIMDWGDCVDELEGCGASVYEFKVPANLDLDTVRKVGMGIAFENSWSLDGTTTRLVEL
jgi:hypothetical protein